MRRWIPAVACAAAVLLGTGTLASRWRLRDGHGQSGVAGATSLASTTPCGGEALNEDSFPPMAQLVASQPSGSGGTADAPGAPDGRPEEFHPDETTFTGILTSEDAKVQMSVFRTNFSHASPSQAANIALVARKLTGQVIAPGATFSYNRVVGPYTERGGYGWGRMFVGERIVPTIGGGVCQGASTLYNVVLLANLPVVERHAHGLTVPYLDPGRDATVTESGGLDFRFRNSTQGPVVLWAQAEDRGLTIALYGQKPAPPVEIHTEVLSRQPFRTVVIADPTLPNGTERVAAGGQDGVRARAWTIVNGPSGAVRHNLGEHTYRPSPRIILRGSGAPQSANLPSASAPATGSTTGSALTSASAPL